MQITLKNLSPTKVELTVSADKAFLDKTKAHVLGDFAKDLNIAGFRKGHAPAALVEKHADPATLQSRFLDHALNDLYFNAVRDQKLRVAGQPQVTVTKFVPFSVLEFKAEVEIIGAVTLPDYKKMKLAKKTETATDKDVEMVLADLRTRDSQKADVERAAKDGDEVVMDFKGVDTKTKKAIAGADGTDFPLTIGSNRFIPGFEPELIGLKPGGTKTFDVTFPADYAAEELRKKKVSFTVTVKTVREITLPALDDAFAAKIGPFKSLGELKADVKKQIQAERDGQAQRAFESELLEMIAAKTKADIPDGLVNEEIDRMETEEKRNLMYRGQTWQEHLEAEGKTDEQHREGLRAQAEMRVKVGLMLGEVAQAEKITVSDAEVDEQIARMKQQYTDEKMRAELSKPENRREIGSRMQAEKTIARLSDYVSANN